MPKTHNMDFYEARCHYESVDRSARDKRLAEIQERRAELNEQRQKVWSEDDRLRREQMAINFVNTSEDRKCVTPA
jgi:hypothetical protein